MADVAYAIINAVRRFCRGHDFPAHRIETPLPISTVSTSCRSTCIQIHCAGLQNDRHGGS